MTFSSFSLRGVCSLLLVAGIAAKNASAFNVTLPNPPGPLAVGSTRVEFTDYSREDPFAPTPTPRSLMLHVRYPISSTSGLQPSLYMPAKSAAFVESYFQIPEGTVDQIATRAYDGGSLGDILVTKDGSIPVLVFSPGSGAPEALYTLVQEAMASYGYITIGIDHTYDSSPTEFSDGTLIQGILSDANNTVSALVRTQDVLALAEQTKSSNLSGWIQGFSGHSRCSRDSVLRWGIFGHSIGGETAALAMQNSTSVYHAAASLDGPSPANLLSSGFHGPFLYEGAKLDTLNYGQLSAIWPNITGFKLAVGFNNSLHDDESDLAVLVPQLPGTGVAQAYKDLLVNPDPVGLQKDMAVYLKAFWDFALRGTDQAEILRHPVPQYPNVTYENP